MEATAPITGLRLRVGPYPGVTGKNALSTEGTPEQQERLNIVTFDKMRIEPVIRLTERPSEHWILNVDVFAPHPKRPNELVLDWDVQPFPHQNAPPIGTPELAFEAAQINQYRLQERPGHWRVSVGVVGIVSGNRYRVSCDFTVRNN